MLNPHTNLFMIWCGGKIKEMKKITKFIILLFVIGGTAYYFKQPIENLLLRVENKILPCQQPIIYSFGFFDERFGITKSDFSDAVSNAIRVWEKPINKKLFKYSDDSSQLGILKINLIYDYRQEMTIKLKNLGIQLNDDKSTYDKIKTEYELMRGSYEEKKTVLDSLINAFNVDKADYDKQVGYWNSRRGAPEKEFNKLNLISVQLKERVELINKLQKEINGLIDNINVLADELNRLAYILNLNVSKYNNIGQQNGGEFQEGLFKRDIKGDAIDIYEFANNEQLMRVLEHELGHALGLEHLENPEAIMYMLNQGKNENLTVDDITALKNKCGIK